MNNKELGEYFASLPADEQATIIVTDEAGFTSDRFEIEMATAEETEFYDEIECHPLPPVSGQPFVYQPDR